MTTASASACDPQNRPSKILVLSRQFPYPPYDGELLPIYHFLRALAPQVRYTLLTVRPADPMRWEEGRALFEGWGIRVVAVDEVPCGRMRQAWRCLRGGVPWLNRFYLPALAARARELLREEPWDLIQTESVLSAQHLPARLPAPLLIITRDCLWAVHARELGQACRRQRFTWLQMHKIRAMERTLLGRAARVITISPGERTHMLQIVPRAVINVVPNGVDYDTLRPTPQAPEPQTVIFTGAMDYGPNEDACLWAAREIWPRVLARLPQAQLWLVGRAPTPAVQTLASEPSITVTGQVPSIGEWIGRASLVISPLRWGAGMKNKVLEGAAMGKPMVVTSVSLEDIALEPGRDLVQANEAPAFAQAIVDLLGDPARAATLGANARRAVEQAYSWDASALQIMNIYGALAQRGQTHADA